MEGSLAVTDEGGEEVESSGEAIDGGGERGGGGGGRERNRISCMT